jgi:hypothetical protein
MPRQDDNDRTGDTTMKIMRMAIIMATLALAGFAGTSADGATLRGAACSLDGMARALSGSPASSTCQR